MLEALTSEEIRETTLDELLTLPSELLTYNHTIAYTGSLPLEDVVEVLRRNHIIGDELQDTPEFQFRRARQVDDLSLIHI